MRPNRRGVKCAIVTESKLLHVQQSYGDRWWSVPGGGVKTSESYIEAAKRELREETSLQAELQHIGTYQQQIEYKNDTVKVFTGSFTTVLEVTIDNREIVAYEWFLINQLPADCRPSVRNIVAMCKNR